MTIIRQTYFIPPYRIYVGWGQFTLYRPDLGQDRAVLITAHISELGLDYDPHARMTFDEMEVYLRKKLIDEDFEHGPVVAAYQAEKKRVDEWANELFKQRGLGPYR